jgi:ElaB/YqjD/DUF883 family membrane-anchored ribosome-binding protein
MNRPDPLNDPARSGVSGAQNPGTAHVESRITSGASGTGSTANRASQLVDEAENAASRAAGRAQELYEDAREGAEELTDRASEYASQARSRVNDAMHRAEDQLEEQTGAISMIREYPLAAAGLAFGVGFLMAGSSSRKRSGVLGRTSGQLRSAVLASVSTMLMQELQEMLDEHGGPAGLLSAITGRGSAPRPESQPPR